MAWSPVRGHGTARGGGALREPRGERAAPLPRSAAGEGTDAAGPPRAGRAPQSPEGRRRLWRRRGSPQRWQPAVSRGRRRGTASELVPAVPAAYITSGKEEEEEKSIKSVNLKSTQRAADSYSSGFLYC